MKKTLAVVAAGLILAGCSNPPDHGTVTGHNYTAAWPQWMPGIPGSCSGKPPICTPGTAGYFIYHPENWSLQINDGKNAGWRDVDETTFHRCQDGEKYPQCANE